MGYRYLDDFRRGISVFAIFSYGIAVLGTPNVPLHIPVEDIALVLQGKSLADMSRLVFLDPNHFREGELHRHTPQWLSLLDDLNDDRFSEVRDWITNGVDVTKFFRPFKGSYKGKNYECSTPPRCVLPNSDFKIQRRDGDKNVA